MHGMRDRHAECRSRSVSGNIRCDPWISTNSDDFGYGAEVEMLEAGGGHAAEALEVWHARVQPQSMVHQNAL